MGHSLQICPNKIQHFLENDFKNCECDCIRLIFHPLGSMNQRDTHSYHLPVFCQHCLFFNCNFTFLKAYYEFNINYINIPFTFL